MDEIERMPVHALLARLGKRALRPGGIELTRKMLSGLSIGPDDRVVEFGSGTGLTARMVLDRHPRSFTAVERDPRSVTRLKELLSRPGRGCVQGTAEATGLASGDATVVYGEAMLTMQADVTKGRIVSEAFRCLRPGGRYGIHEMALVPDDLPDPEKQVIKQDLSGVARIGNRPFTVGEWRMLLEGAGFVVEVTEIAPLHLLEARRVLSDEGPLGTLWFAWNVMRAPAARRRVRAMREAFRRHSGHIRAVILIARKAAPGEATHPRAV